MVYNFITSEPEIREQININYRYYTVKSFTFALLTEKGDIITREVANTFINNPLFKKGNFPLKMALGELVDANTSMQERVLGRSLGVKIVKLEVEPFGKRAAVDDDRIYSFDPLD